MVLATIYCKHAMESNHTSRKDHVLLYVIIWNKDIYSLWKPTDK